MKTALCLILVVATALPVSIASAQAMPGSAQSGALLGVDHAQQQQARQWFHDKERGWFWYEDPPAETEPEDLGTAMPSLHAMPADPLAELEAFQENLERAKALAVLHPTTDNVRAYLQINREVQSRAAIFADVTQRIVWTTPELDQSLVRPHSQEGLTAWTAAKNESKARSLREIAQTYGLFFVFSSDCPYCVQFAPFMRRFAQAYGFKLIPISIDGGTLAEFPDARYEPTIANRLGVEITPAVFLVDPDAGHIQPVAYGVVSITELETRITRLFTMEPGEMTYSVYDAGRSKQ